MLTDKLKSDIKKVDILTDFDKTMINEQSFYKQILAYFSYLRGLDRLSFLGKLMKNYEKCRTKDVRFFYFMLKECQVKLLDEIVSGYTNNERWDELVDKLGMRSIGIVSRSNQRLISKYLNLKIGENNNIVIVAANKPEIKDDVYTGNVELVVNNDNLIDFVEEKAYICGKDEKKILERRFGIYFLNMKHGLYISTKQKIFVSKFSPKSLKISSNSLSYENRRC